MLMIGLFYFVASETSRKIAERWTRTSPSSRRASENSPLRGPAEARLDAKKPIADGIYRTRGPLGREFFCRGLAFVIGDDCLDSFVGRRRR